MKIKLPEEVEYIIKTLEDSGFEAYAVGGCIRDCIMGAEPKDWDICTQALPRQAMECFAKHRTFETGLKHGTISLRLNKQTYEITTFREDGHYEDNRRPESVQFIADIKSDLARRDFTINALAYNRKKGLIDYFGGINDIENKTLRCVGNAGKRFEEDALRIMRALRFASSLELKIEPTTANEIINKRKLLENIAAERISVELDGLLTGRNAEKILSDFTSVIETIIPEITDMVGFEQNNPYHYLDVWNHTVKSVINAPKDKAIRLTMLLHDIGKPSCYTYSEGKGHFHGHQAVSEKMARKILGRLKYDNDTIHTVTKLILYHDVSISPDNRQIKRWLNRLGETDMLRLIEVKRADAMAQSEQYRDSRLEELGNISQMISEIIKQQQCFSLKDMAINGKDLIEIGFPQDSSIGATLKKLLEMIIDEQIENDRLILLSTADTLLKQS